MSLHGLKVVVFIVVVVVVVVVVFVVDFVVFSVSGVVFSVVVFYSLVCFSYFGLQTNM